MTSIAEERAEVAVVRLIAVRPSGASRPSTAAHRLGYDLTTSS